MTTFRACDRCGLALEGEGYCGDCWIATANEERQRTEAERAKVAHLRSRVIGLYGALREATHVPLVIVSTEDGKRYVVPERIAELEAVAREALAEWADALEYKPVYLITKHGDREHFDKLVGMVDPGPTLAELEAARKQGGGEG